MEECYFIQNNTPPWVFFMFYKLHKWHQIGQHIIYIILYNPYKRGK